MSVLRFSLLNFHLTINVRADAVRRDFRLFLLRWRTNTNVEGERID